MRFYVVSERPAAKTACRQETCAARQAQNIGNAMGCPFSLEKIVEGFNPEYPGCAYHGDCPCHGDAFNAPETETTQ